MTPLPRPRLPVVVLLILLPVLAACSGDDPAPAPAAQPPDPAAAEAPPSDAVPAPETATPEAPAVLLPAPFENDAALEARLDPGALGIPGRFVRVARDDREPILSLGLVGGAARLTYAAAASNEVLSLDLLRLEPGIDAESFFLAFAAAVADSPDYRGLDMVGVPRGVGDGARHYAFTIDDDEADAVVLLRDDLLAFVTYRRPPNLRSPVDVAALMRAVDAALQAPAGG